MDEEPRLEKISTLDKRVRAFDNGYRQNVAIIGNDSEELSYFFENYFTSNRLNTLTYIHTTTAYTGKQEFFKAIAFSILNSYTHKNDTLDNLINCINSSLPLTTEFIKDCLKKENLSFLDAIEVINKFINETNRRCLFIIEEFLAAVELFEDFYQSFSKFIILQRNCMIILTTSSPKKAKRVLSSELNLLFGNFELASLNDKSALDNFFYLKNLIEPVKPSPFFLSFFINIIGSNIIYYDIAAKFIKTSHQPDDEVNTIINVLQDMLYSKESYFFQRFIKKIDILKANSRDFAPMIKLLFALSKGYLRKKELISLGIYSSKDINHKLQKLCDLNHIENLGNIYKIKDYLFSFWLTTVFKWYFTPPILNSQQRRMLYRKRAEEEVAIFKEEFFQNKLQRILQLFSSFKNDTLNLGKNCYRLPLIEKTKIISYPQKEFHLLVGEGKEIIFAGIKEREVDNADIFEFIEKGANIKGKRVKKIFVSLDNIPSTARLIAKNNKLTIWDINDVNRLLNVYNKPILDTYLL